MTITFRDSQRSGKHGDDFLRVFDCVPDVCQTRRASPALGRVLDLRPISRPAISSEWTVILA